MIYNSEQLTTAKSRKDLIHIAKESKMNIEKQLKYVQYETELAKLQSELVNLQQWIQ